MNQSVTSFTDKTGIENVTRWTLSFTSSDISYNREEGELLTAVNLIEMSFQVKYLFDKGVAFVASGCVICSQNGIGKVCNRHVPTQLRKPTPSLLELFFKDCFFLKNFFSKKRRYIIYSQSVHTYYTFCLDRFDYFSLLFHLPPCFLLFICASHLKKLNCLTEFLSFVMERNDLT